jgi:hypothetical protein
MEPEAAATPEPCKHGFRAAACLWKPDEKMTVADQGYRFGPARLM